MSYLTILLEFYIGLLYQDRRDSMPPLEKNGFVIVDVTKEEIGIKFYAWRLPEPEDAIEDLKPHYTVRYPFPWNPKIHPGEKGKTGP